MSKQQVKPQRSLVGIKVLGGEIYRLDGEFPDPMQPMDYSPAKIRSITAKGASAYVIERSDGSEVVLSHCPVIALFEPDKSEAPLSDEELATVRSLQTIRISRPLPPGEEKKLQKLLDRAERHKQADIVTAPPVEKALENEPRYRDDNDNPLDDEDVEGPPVDDSAHQPTGHAAQVAARMASVGSERD